MKKLIGLVWLCLFLAVDVWASYDTPSISIAEDWTYGAETSDSPLYWDLQPVNPKNIFKVGETVCVLSKVKNITDNHRWKSQLVKGSDVVQSVESQWNDVGTGWSYSTMYPKFQNLVAGVYVAKVWLDVGGGYALFGTESFEVQVLPSDDDAPSLTIAEDWTYGAETSDSPLYWDLQPVNPKKVFYVGDQVCILSKVVNIASDHRWKTQVTRGTDIILSVESQWNDVGTGWTYSTMYPIMQNVQVGSYVAKSWLDVGNGYELIGEDTFEVKIIPSYSFTNTILCSGWYYGANSETDPDYWNLQPVNQGNVFVAGTKVYALSKIEAVIVDHRFKTDFIFENKVIYTYSSDWHKVDGVWAYSSTYPSLSVQKLGDYQVKTYLDIGKGFQLLDTVSYKVVPVSLAPVYQILLLDK